MIRIVSLQSPLEHGLPVGSVIQTEEMTLSELKHLKPAPEDITYLDIAGLDVGGRKKAIKALNKLCSASAWGIIDREGAIDDPAQLFFAGASDYLGKGVPVSQISRARMKAIQSYASGRTLAGSSPGLAASANAGSGADANPGKSSLNISTGIAPADRNVEFPGWKAVRAGVVYPFFFLYVSVSAQMNLKTRLGETGYVSFRDRLRIKVQQTLAEADPLLWMETDSTSLYLIPSRLLNARATVVACLRMLLWAPLIGYEKFGLPFPITFTFAMHHGRTEFAAPGKTGTIVSDAVNFIYHLGTKRAEPGCLTVSADVSRGIIPDTMLDLFVDGGTFEGRALVQSRRFGS